MEPMNKYAQGFNIDSLFICLIVISICSYIEFNRNRHRLWPEGCEPLLLALVQSSMGC